MNATLVSQEGSFTVRGGRPVADFPRQYRAESLDISLHLARSSRLNYMVLGILTSTDANERINAFKGMYADLYTAPGPLVMDGDEQAEKPLLRTRIDELGHMVFCNVPEGTYVLILHLPGREVIIEDLTIAWRQ